MKSNSFCSKISLVLICAGLFLLSCKKGPEMSFPKDDIIFDASGTDTTTLQVSANVTWTASISDEWLKASTLIGEGSATIKLWADENGEFSERVTYIVISGDDVRTDSIKVVQAPSIDVVEKIEDVAFRKYCLELFDDSGDGRISLKEAKNTDDVIEDGRNNSKAKIIVKGKGIKTLAGIEYFTKIRELNCENNQIEKLDVSKNKELRILNCSYNQIEEIEIDKLTKLSVFKIYNNKFKNIDVSQNENLEELWVSNNSITSINVANNRKLFMFYCDNNQLPNIDVSNNTELSTFSCTKNELTALDLKSNTKLVNLYCSENRFTTLDLSNNKDLQALWCNGTEDYQITSLNVANNVKLIKLYCNNNRLSSLDLKNNTMLVYLYCSNNNLKGELDISKNKELKYIDLKTNPGLTAIKVWPEFDILNKNYVVDDKNLWTGYIP